MDMGRIKTPAFYVCSWYDSARTPLISHCQAQRENEGDSRVLIAPWQPGESPAPCDNALKTGNHPVDIQREIVQWFDHFLKGGSAPAWQPYRYYDITSGQAQALTKWDKDGEAHSTWYLGEGRRLLVEIAGSAFPKYDPNHGTAARPALDTHAVTSQNQIHRSGAFASFITLPLSR